MFHKALAADQANKCPAENRAVPSCRVPVRCQVEDNALVIALPGQAIALQPAKPLRVEIAHKLGRFRHLTSLSKISPAF